MADLVRHDPKRLAPVPSDDEIERLYRVAKALALSGMFKDARQAEQAFALIVIGRDLGLSPAQSMTGIHIVEGKPMLHYSMLGAFVRAHARYDYRVIEHSDQACALEFLQDGEVVGVSRFTMEDATQANLGRPTRNGQVSNWVKYPRNMLMARAMSNGVRWFAPDALGGMPVYVEDEIIESTADDLTATDEPARPVDEVLPAEVEAVLARAASIGHKGIGSRATAAMAVRDQPPEVVEAKVHAWTVELDRFEAEARERVLSENPADAGQDQPEGDTAPDAPAAAGEAGESAEPLSAEDSAGIEAAIQDRIDAADAADGEGDTDAAERLRGEASELMDRLDAIRPEPSDGGGIEL